MCFKIAGMNFSHINSNHIVLEDWSDYYKLVKNLVKRFLNKPYFWWQAYAIIMMLKMQSLWN